MRKRVAVPAAYHAVQLGSPITLPSTAAALFPASDHHNSQTFDSPALKAYGCELPTSTK